MRAKGVAKVGYEWGVARRQCSLLIGDQLRGISKLCKAFVNDFAGKQKPCGDGHST